MKKSKKILLTILASLTMLGTLVACSGEEGPGPQFLEGAQTRFELTDSVMIKDIVDIVTDSEYTITISKGDFSVDVTNKSFWAPFEPGEYTITYTVEEGVYEGTNTFIFVVRAPKLDWEYTIPTDIYDVGQQLVFEEYFDRMNSYVESWYPYQVVMDSVTFGDTTIDLTNETSYIFTDSMAHLFKFHVETQDGQLISSQASIEVRYINAQTRQWLEDNNITTYNELRLNDDGSVMLGKSTHSGDNVQQPVAGSKHDNAYLAYNGNYGLNDYLVLDFTGNNMPVISFFNGALNNSVYNVDSAPEEENKGILLSNGWTTKKGVPFAQWETSINNYVQLLGPYKIGYIDTNAQGTFRYTVKNSASFAMTQLVKNPDTHYRMIMGYSDGHSDGFTVEIFVYDLDRGRIVYNNSTTISGLSKHDIALPDDYFNGNIVLYGMYGINTTIDKLYPIVQDTTMEAVRDTYCRASSFQENAKQAVELNEQLNVADYIDPAVGANYWLKLTDPDGNVTDITGEETFTVSKIGTYTLSYNDGTYATSALRLVVQEIAPEMKTWMQENNVTSYMAEKVGADGSVLLGKSMHSGSDAAMPSYQQVHDMSYIAYNGEYGVNDFLVVDFTGNNMPYITFFADEVTASAYYNPDATVSQNKGVVISNGAMYQNGQTVTPYDSTYNKRFMVYGPNKIIYTDGSNLNSTNVGWGPMSIFGTGDHIGVVNLMASNDQYRLIIGITEYNSSRIVISAYAYNVTKKVLVQQNTLTVNGVYDADTFTGSIVLHGMIGKTTKLDKIYAIEEDTTFNVMIDKYVPASQFKTTAKTSVAKGQTLNVADYIQTVAGETYSLSYIYNDVETPITGDTFTFTEFGKYTLVYNDGVNRTNTLTVMVENIDAAFATWMEENNVSIYNSVSATGNGRVELAASTHSGGQTAMPSYQQTHDMSYLAFNGEYGTNDFVVLDFTGNNMPYITFFVDEVTNSAYYNPNATDAQNKGVVISNGAMYQNGQTVTPYDNTYNKRFMVYGPNKIIYTDGSNLNGANVGWGPMSIFGTGDHIGVANLVNSTDQYRMIIGITEYNSSKIVVSAYVYNLTQKVLVQRNVLTVNGTYNADTFTGSIVLHGMIGKTTTLDKVYAIEENVTMEDMLEKYFPLSQFKAGAETLVVKGQVLNVSDYIETVTGATYSLSYIYDDDNQVTPITGNTFSFNEFGKYTLVYSDGVNRENRLTITVENIDAAFAAWMEENNVSIYNSVSANGSAITLKASTHDSTNVATSMTGGNTIHDMSYLAYNGNYQAGDFLVVDFTGDNMPYINFFAGEVTNSIFYSASASAAQNKGITYTHGFRNQETGAIFTAIPYNRPQLIGVSKIYKPFEDAQPCDFRSNVLTQAVASGDMAPIGMEYMSGRYANTRMRMIIGFSETSNANASFTFNVTIINLDTGAIICNGGRIISGKAALSTFDFSGSIVMYAPHGKDLVLDKVYAIEENTTMEALIAKYQPQA